MRFKVSIRPEPNELIVEGEGELADTTIIMGRRGKSLFLRYLFALLADDLQLAHSTSSALLGPGGTAMLEVDGVGRLECSRDGKVGCIVNARRREAYLFYEGWAFTARYGREVPLPKAADAMDRLFRKVAELPGRRYGLLLSAEDGAWHEVAGGKRIPLALASTATVTAGVLERALQLKNAWLLLDGTLDSLFPDDIFYLAGLSSASKARIVLTTHSPWIRKAFKCHKSIAESLGLPSSDKRSAAAYEFVAGGVREIVFASETYGEEFSKLYKTCGGE